MRRQLVRSALLWGALLAASVLVHLLVSREAGTQLALVVSPDARPDEQVEISLEPIEEPEPEELVYEEPIDFEPAVVLVTAEAQVTPPPAVDLQLEAAAGGSRASDLAMPLMLAERGVDGDGEAGFGRGVGIGLSQTDNAFALYVQSLIERGLDVVFVVDATGSMDWVIAEVRLRIRDIVESVRSLVPLARFSIVAYRDYDDPEFVTRIQPLTFSLAKLGRFLDALTAVGGGSWHEAVDAGLERAVNDAGWRPGARRVVIIIGDAPPHPGKTDRLLRMTEDLVSNGGQVSTLDVSHESNPALLEAFLGRKVNRALYHDEPMLQFRRIADAGDGRASNMDGDIVVARQLLSLVMGGEFSQEMQRVMDSL